ncbi:MAG: PD-(D/E)XK nuclease family protein [Desulfohalobiaceae bacterium]
MTEHESIPLDASFAALETGATLLTVNRRLSQGLLQRYQAQMQAKGEQAWETPDILPWAGWISRCLQQACYACPDPQQPAILTQEQELALWEKIIQASEHSRGLLYLGQTARQASQAWTLFRHWQLQHKAEPWLWSSPDQEAFWDWSQEFQDVVQARGWLEEARQPEYLTELFSSGILPAPQKIILAGFEQLSPLQQQLLQTLQHMGCFVYLLQQPAQQGRARKLALQDQKQELRWAARWARAQLLSNPAQSLGIIVPNLSQLRQELLETLDAVLHPDSAYTPVDPDRRCFDISLGQNLSSYPLIQAALDILDLAQDPLELKTISSLLRSPFVLAADSEISARARLETSIRDTRQACLSWRQLQRLLDSGSCPALARSARAFQARAGQLPHSQPPSAWAQDLDLLLRDLGWPGERSLSSPEHQTRQAWYNCLQRLSTLDRIWPRLELKQAISRLREILAQTVFQPEGPQAQVRVMGMLEAVAQDFDQIWILGLTDQAWPPAAEPSPFLPIPVQQAMDMPRSSPEHELFYARRITSRLLTSAKQILLSYPQQEEDRELLPSPLLSGIPDLEPQELQLAPDPDPWQEQGSATDLETFQDQQAPSLVSGQAPGGTGLLRSQALCPFQAFARYRMQAEALQGPAPGLDALERGSTMHKALEHFWRNCQDQSTLLGLSRQARADLVQEAAAHAVHGQAWKRPSLSKVFFALEEQRLQELLLEWLQLEEQRSPFQVQALEKRLDIDLAGLKLNVAVDRIDRLQDDRLVVIDYKSGRHSASQWLRDRPEEPQLPLYSLFCQEPVAGVYFAVLRKGETRFAGLGEQAGIVPGCPGYARHSQTKAFSSWQEILETWRSRLEDLAAEILGGEARAAPKDRQTCRQCDLEPLCRILELEGK